MALSPLIPLSLLMNVYEYVTSAMDGISAWDVAAMQLGAKLNAMQDTPLNLTRPSRLSTWYCTSLVDPPAINALGLHSVRGDHYDNVIASHMYHTGAV